MNMPGQFTDEEWSRKDGFTEKRGDESWVWSTMCMQWIVHSNGRYRRVSPDHERMQADPEAAPIIALVHRLTSAPKKHLKIVR